MSLCRLKRSFVSIFLRRESRPKIWLVILALCVIRSWISLLIVWIFESANLKLPSIATYFLSYWLRFTLWAFTLASNLITYWAAFATDSLIKGSYFYLETICSPNWEYLFLVWLTVVRVDYRYCCFWISLFYTFLRTWIWFSKSFAALS